MRNPLIYSGLGSGYPQLLRGRWQQRSEQTGWRFPGDWLVPEVEGVIQARIDGGTLQSAAKRLGASRAYQGVGVRETMLDLSAFFAAADVPTDDETMRDLVEGWAAENERCEPFSCTDVRTGLPTLAHFERLLYDLSMSAEAHRREVALATLHLEWAESESPLGWPLLADIGHVVLRALAGVNATATVHGTHIYVLMRRNEESYTALKACVDSLDNLKAAPGRSIASFARLPSSPSDYALTAALLESSGPH